MCKIVSFCKHGLVVDDIINLYFNSSNSTEEPKEDIIIKNLRVLKVEDEYVFYVKYSEQDWVATPNFIYWTSAMNFATALNNNGLDSSSYTWNSSDRRCVTKQDGDSIETFVVFNKNGQYCANLDSVTNDVSFKQVINNEEVQYYVRIFSKLPNWKLAEKN